MLIGGLDIGTTGCKLTVYNSDGRNVMREKGILEFLKPAEEKSFEIKFEFFTI